MRQGVVKMPKRAYTIITRYRNNKEREYTYVKYFTQESYAANYCGYRMNNTKVFSCTFELSKSPAKAKKKPSKNALTPIKGLKYYFRDKEGYKYYINNGMKIKSAKPVYEI